MQITISLDLHWEHLDNDYSVNGFLIPLLYENLHSSVYMVNDRDLAWLRQV